MNQEDILKMAREADPEFDSDPEDMPHCLLGMDAVERFAALVAAKAALDERDALCDIVDSELDFNGQALAIKQAVRARGR